MSFLPSNRIYEALRAELTGVWLDPPRDELRPWLIAKLPMNTIRAVDSGAPIFLKIWIVAVEGRQVPCFGLQIDEDPVRPWFFHGACDNLDSVAALRALLGGSEIQLQLHNEVFLPVLAATCDLTGADQVRSTLARLGESGLEVAPFVVREKALDSLEGTLSPGAAQEAIVFDAKIPLAFAKKTALKVHVVGSGVVSLEDADQGGELERLTFQAFDFLCPYGAFVNPVVLENGKKRELCDVLALSRVSDPALQGLALEGLFVVQSKVANTTAESLHRKTSRRAASVEKNLMTAISQLKGAIKSLHAGYPVFKNDGSALEVDPPVEEVGRVLEPLDLQARLKQVGHAIAMLSDMHDEVDWPGVATALQEAGRSVQGRFLFHVLDLRELQRLVTYSRGRPAVFESLLIDRWGAIRTNGTALVRSHMSDSRPPSA